MRKCVLLLSILIAGSASTAALAAKTTVTVTPAKYSTTPANSNESSWRILRDGLMQIFVPFQSLARR